MLFYFHNINFLKKGQKCGCLLQVFPSVGAGRGCSWKKGSKLKHHGSQALQTSRKSKKSRKEKNVLFIYIIYIFFTCLECLESVVYKLFKIWKSSKRLKD
ncbi:hypothetical protein NL108_008262 [Boleophthalmus pectinirostris]|nr:hypothetical protein NL108_008262 [Boleophthalmus pectinirostris]